MLNIRLRHGYTLCVPDNLALMTPYVLLEQESWFEDEVDLLPQLAPPGTVLVDVGANQGVYTLALARRAYTHGGRVLAFEPNPDLHPGLQASLEANGLSRFVTLRQEGLSRAPGQARFHIPPNPELASLTPMQGAREVEVELTTLDALAASLAPGERLGLMKLDAEGAELDILAGGHTALAAHQPIVMFEIKHGSTFNTGLAEALVARGYALYRVLPGFGLLTPWAPGEALDGYQLNLIACPPAEVARLQEAGLLLSAEQIAQAAADEPVDLPLLRSVLHAEPERLTPELHTLAMHLARALDERLAGPLRYAHAHAARLGLQLRLDTEGLAPEWRLALARLDQMRGERVAAQAHIQAVLPQLPDLAEPVLLVSPHPAFDHQPIGTERAGWLRCALHEARVRLMRYSGYFGVDLNQLKAIHAMPQHTLEMDRRLALALLKAGKKITILPESALCSDQHLNGQVWQAIARGEYRVEVAGAKLSEVIQTDPAELEGELPEGIWLHVGGKEPKSGWQMLNITPGPGVDMVGDIRNLFHLEAATCARVYASHVLEHVHQNEVLGVLKGFARLLKPGGQLLISVPDMDTLCRHYLDPRLTPQQRHHVMRMMFGGQTDAHDFHYVGFNFEFLSGLLQQAGFGFIERVERFGLFQDTSNFAPYGQLISLNVIASNLPLKKSDLNSKSLQQDASYAPPPKPANSP